MQFWHYESELLLEIMFCPDCGKGDQQAETYCRSCGEFLIDYSGGSYLLNKVFGGSTPATQINVNLAINLITIFTSCLLLGFLNGQYDALKDRTGEQPPSIIYLVYTFLVIISTWQIFSLAVGARLRSRLGRKEVPAATEPEDKQNNFHANRTQEFLPTANFSRTVPLSVTEDSTKILYKRNPNETHS